MTVAVRGEDARWNSEFAGAASDHRAGHADGGTSCTVPVSFAQERLWFLDQLEPGLSVYNIPRAFRLRGPLDVDVLERSLNEIVRRHEALRTTFDAVDGVPHQIIAPAMWLRVSVVDMQALPEAERAAESKRLASEEAGRPFDLTRGPLVRAVLLRCTAEEHVLVVTMHHIVSEGGWSMNIFLHELGVLYEAYRRGERSPLPPLPMQYADFAVWQRERLQGEALERELAYWTEQLAGAPAVLELPADRPRPADQSYRGARTELRLPRELLERVRALSTAEGVTVSMTLLAAWLVVLHRYTGREDMVVWMPMAGRTHLEAEGVIGFFVNTLAVRVDVSGDPAFRQLLARVREAALGAFAHQDLPLARLVEVLRPERVRGRTPPIQIMFSPQPQSADPLTLTGVEVHPVEVDTGTTAADATLFSWEGPDGVRLVLEYCTDLFEPSRMQRMLAHYRTVLESSVADPVRPVSALPLLTDAERYQMLVEWSAAAHAVPAIGSPREDTRVYVLDAHLQPVPVGIAGELYVGEAGVMRDRLMAQGPAAQRWVQDLFSGAPGARLYPTGDRAHWRSDGMLELLGRVDHQVTLRGVRIDLGEVEAAITQHPAVRASVAMVREDKPGDARLVAYVVPAEERGATPRDLRDFLRARLPGHMVPSFVVTLAALPLTENGEVDRWALPAPARSHAAPAVVDEPRSALELQLKVLWQQLLGVKPIGVRENFFELGGHSLLAVRLFSEIEQRFGQHLPLATLLRAPTISQLATVLHEARGADWSPLVALQPHGSRPPIFFMHPVAGNVLLFRDLALRLAPDQPVYALQAVGLNGTEPPQTIIEDMAASYIREIRSVQPNGPYYLGGLSFGGMVAFEMALQLQRQGQEVGLVVLFDTMLHPRFQVSSLGWAHISVMKSVGRVGWHIRHLFLPAEERRLYLRDVLARVKGRIRTRLRKATAEGLSDAAASVPYRNIRQASQIAFRTYRPRRYPGRVVFFRGLDRSDGPEDAARGWNRWVARGLEIHDAPGGHVSLIAEPHVAMVAEELKRCLRDAQADSACGGGQDQLRVARSGRV